MTAQTQSIIDRFKSQDRARMTGLEQEIALTHDPRIAVITAILDRTGPKRGFLSNEVAAECILEALDQRAQNKLTKWEGARATAIDEIICYIDACWIPQGDLLHYLNELPGPPLTMSDLKYKIGITRTANADPDLQASCLRIYQREKMAGTALPAIVQLIQNEVLSPDEHRRQEADSEEYHQTRRQSAESGKDFRFQRGALFGLDTNDLYSRFSGQLYRMVYVYKNERLGRKASGTIYRVDKLGDIGTPIGNVFYGGIREISDAVEALKK